MSEAPIGLDYGLMKQGMQMSLDCSYNYQQTAAPSIKQHCRCHHTSSQVTIAVVASITCNIALACLASRLANVELWEARHAFFV